MYKVVTIGEKEVPMLSMASTDLYYKNAFGEDPLKIQTSDDYDAADFRKYYETYAFEELKQNDREMVEYYAKRPLGLHYLYVWLNMMDAIDLQMG